MTPGKAWCIVNWAIMTGASAITALAFGVPLSQTLLLATVLPFGMWVGYAYGQQDAKAVAKTTTEEL